MISFKKFLNSFGGIYTCKGSDLIPDYLKTVHREFALFESMNEGLQSRFLNDVSSKTFQRFIGGEFSPLDSEEEQIEESGPLVVEINGIAQRNESMMTRFGFGFSTKSIEDLMARVEKDDSITSVVFRVNSPGGAAIGNESASEAIFNSSKPTFVHFDVMASAALETFKGSGKVFGSERGAKVGSYGEMITYVDRAKAMGIEDAVTVVYAPQSTKKNEPVREIKKGNLKPVQEMMRESVERMYDGMNRQRPGITSDEWKDGRIMSAERATEINLIDGIASFHEVLEMASAPELTHDLQTRQLARELLGTI